MTKPRRPVQPVADAPARAGHARLVADLLPDIGRAAFRKFGFVQSAIVSRWPEIVGERHARVSAPESIRFPQGKRAEGVLTLVVVPAHGTLMQHIAPEIIERVNRFFGYPAVARIAFRQGVVARRAPPAPQPSTAQPQTVDLGDSVRGIVDPELREVLAALAAGVAEQPPVSIPVMGKVK